MIELKQKYGFYKKEFKLSESSLEIKTKKLGSSDKRSIDLQHIGHQRIYKSISKITDYIISFFLLSFALFVLIFFFLNFDENFPESLPTLFGTILLFGGIGILLLVTPKKEEVYLVDGPKVIKLFANSPSKLEVENFIDLIIKKSKNQLKIKFGKIDVDLPIETQLEKLNFLRIKNIITEEEYNDLKNKYKEQKIINGL